MGSHAQKKFRAFLHLVFFVVGISIGISFSLYFKSFLFLLKASIISNVSLQAPPFILLQPPSLPQQSTPSPPPPPLSPLPPLPPPPPAAAAEIKPSLMHNMEDEELFSRASLVPKTVREFPNRPLPKVAFMFLTKGPIPLSPLWEIFFKGHEELYNIYVHRHPSFIDSTPDNSVFNGRSIPSQLVEWGTSTMMDAERRLLGNALLDSSNERFILLSESCIPLFNFTTIYSYLINSHKSFTGSFDDPSKVGRGRYNPKMSPTISLSDWRKGSQWFEVNRKLALEIISDTKYYPVFREHCNMPCYIDEHYIPTLINILRPEENSNRSVTWVDWSRAGPHPGRFVRNDVSAEFLNRIRSGTSNCTYNGNTTTLCFLFARKFVPNTLQPLLQFAPLLLNTSVQV
ncbi:Glycosyl transferase [Parasponia andersonii]|uniref:Glycosyl transferase n=1 Tax=Parasponia andersonii TaxID=3476 RepID=A0A2P5AEF1_PARAD|nr:Glycosyl transferase [Parasponia andersonii]